MRDAVTCSGWRCWRREADLVTITEKADLQQAMGEVMEAAERSASAPGHGMRGLPLQTLLTATPLKFQLARCREVTSAELLACARSCCTICMLGGAPVARARVRQALRRLQMPDLALPCPRAGGGAAAAARGGVHADADEPDAAPAPGAAAGRRSEEGTPFPPRLHPVQSARAH